MKFKVCYTGTARPEFDKKICDILEHAGARWYAQGADLTTGHREICFDIDADRRAEESE